MRFRLTNQHSNKSVQHPQLLVAPNNIKLSPVTRFSHHSRLTGARSDSSGPWLIRSGTRCASSGAAQGYGGRRVLLFGDGACLGDLLPFSMAASIGYAGAVQTCLAVWATISASNDGARAQQQADIFQPALGLRTLSSFRHACTCGGYERFGKRIFIFFCCVVCRESLEEPALLHLSAIGMGLRGGFVACPGGHHATALRQDRRGLSVVSKLRVGASKGHERGNQRTVAAHAVLRLTPGNEEHGPGTSATVAFCGLGRITRMVENALELRDAQNFTRRKSGESTNAAFRCSMLGHNCSMRWPPPQSNAQCRCLAWAHGNM